jgi:hypothetical protein
LDSHQPVKVTDGAESLNATMESICQESLSGSKNFNCSILDCEWHLAASIAVPRSNPRASSPNRVGLQFKSSLVAMLAPSLNGVAVGTTRGTPRLDYSPTLVYPEACHSMLQQG